MLDDIVIQRVQTWLQDVVVGLSLCPFAQWPLEQGQVRLAVSAATDDASLLVDIDKEVQRLDETDPEILETTLLIIPQHLRDFDDYLALLTILEYAPWQGEYQVASFHPDYCFDGAEPADQENLTNRAPYPIFHLLREQSVEAVLKNYKEPESIPERNINTVQALKPAQIARLFPYIH